MTETRHETTSEIAELSQDIWTQFEQVRRAEERLYELAMRRIGLLIRSQVPDASFVEFADHGDGSTSTIHTPTQALDTAELDDEFQDRLWDYLDGTLSVHQPEMWRKYAATGQVTTDRDTGTLDSAQLELRLMLNGPDDRAGAA